MHDVPLGTLEEVVKFPQSGRISNPHQDNTIIPLELSNGEQQDVVASAIPEWRRLATGGSAHRVSAITGVVHDREGPWSPDHGPSHRATALLANARPVQVTEKEKIERVRALPVSADMMTAVSAGSTAISWNFAQATSNLLSPRSWSYMAAGISGSPASSALFCERLSGPLCRLSRALGF